MKEICLLKFVITCDNLKFPEYDVLSLDIRDSFLVVVEAVVTVSDAFTDFIENRVNSFRDSWSL